MDRIPRCQDCLMHQWLCICDLVEPIATKTRCVLMIHAFEVRKPTNTGRLASACLQNSKVLVRGQKDKPPFTRGEVHQPGYQSVVLFPSETAEVLTPEYSSKFDQPLNLIIPDGNWRQASRIPKREPHLAGLPHVIIDDKRPTNYRLRVEPRLPYGLATMEAVARALGVIEGREVEERMQHIFRTMVERTLWTKGKLPTAEVYGGVPEAAIAGMQGRSNK